jgi:hypothetical protein
MPPRSRLRSAALAGIGAALAVGCLKTLDEGLIDATGGAAGAGGVVGGSGGVGGGGSGGTGGDGGSGGTTPDASGGAAGGIVPHDPKKYPVTNIGSGSPPVVIGADDSTVFRTTKSKADASLVSQPTAGGSGSSLATLEKPQALAVGAQYVFIAGGRNTADEGSITRVPKAGGPKENVPVSPAIGLASGIHVGPDAFVYVTVDAVSAGAAALFRFDSAGTSLQSLFTSSGGNEPGGDLAVRGGCVYWIAGGALWISTTAGGGRKPAVSSPVTDVVGVTTDPTSVYFTRAAGSLWRRSLSSSACDGSGPAEVELTSGYTAIGDVVAYDGTVAFTAMGDKAQSYAGGGVFALPAAGGTVTQIAPAELGPIDIDESGTFLVYATDVGPVRRVPKTPQG